MPTIVTPVGRLVYGHPARLVAKTDMMTKQPVMKDGKPVMVRSFGVAFPKEAFNTHLWPTMYHAAKSVFGNYDPPMPPTRDFAWKYKDGDWKDKQQKPYSEREGYAGHCVVHFETQFDLLSVKMNAAGNGYDQITEHDYKTGDYVAVNCSIEGNKPTNAQFTPGLFINPQGVIFVGVGQAIINAPSADQMFGGQQFTLPPGATAPGAAPTMPAGLPTPPGMAAPAPAAPPVPMAAPAAPPVAAAPTYPPAHDFVANATGQPVYAASPAPAGAPVPPTMPPGAIPTPQ